jgi:hypothetical protein
MPIEKQKINRKNDVVIASAVEKSTIDNEYIKITKIPVANDNFLAIFTAILSPRFH